MTKTRIDRLRTEQRSFGDRQRSIECFVSIDKQQHQQQQHNNITDFTRANSSSLFFYSRTIVVFVAATNLIRQSGYNRRGVPLEAQHGHFGTIHIWTDLGYGSG